MRTDENDLPESVTSKRYAPPKAAAIPNRPPRPVGFVGLALYLVFTAWTIAAATEVLPLGSALGADATFLGGIAGACTAGRYYRSRWLGGGIGLVVTFLAIGFAIYLRHALDNS